MTMRVRFWLLRFWVCRVVLPLGTALIDGLAKSREPDFVIGGVEHPYLRRWYLTPWSGLYRTGRRTWWQKAIKAVLPNLYLHQILRSDDDRALHDHPWFNASLILSGGYVEHTIQAGGINRRDWRYFGDVKVRSPRAAHRLELPSGCLAECWTLFLTGPVWRDWGFHCPRGWRHWRDFTNPLDRGATIGRGCE
jgi:hypothetical protein